eukprot:2322915-Prorocentrum_lima.AAC.1
MDDALSVLMLNSRLLCSGSATGWLRGARGGFLSDMDGVSRASSAIQRRSNCFAMQNSSSES